MLSKEQIRGAQDRPREWVPIVDWAPADETFDPQKHGVWVGTMSGKDRDSWESECLKRKGDLANVRATFAVRAVQNPDGARIFLDSDAEWLGDKAAGPLDEIFAVAMRLNKLRKEDQEALAGN
jgi:hypothetical protein